VTLRVLALHWSVDGSTGLGFLLVTLAAGALYIRAAIIGSRRDRRRRRWPRGRTVCFLFGIGVMVVDLYSGVGALADSWLSVHMVEHMVLMQVVAPLLVAANPARLALFAGDHNRRRRLAGWLHSRSLGSLSTPLGTVVVFSAVIVVTHVPAVYGLALTSNDVHIAEHAAYLQRAAAPTDALRNRLAHSQRLSSILMWVPLLGADRLPHRHGDRDRILCIVGCMLSMLLVGAWLASSPRAVYGAYVVAPGHAALHGQRVAAAIMLLACLPMIAVAGLPRPRAPRLVPKIEPLPAAADS
jgi:cytochrome c oxidase assembly factor CtaG